MKRRSGWWWSGFVVVLPFLYSACETGTEIEPPDGEVATLPLLGPGRFLSTTSYGSAPGPEDASIRSVVREAAGAGMNGFAFWIDWQD